VPFHRQRILLAEDNAINQQIAVLLMRERMNLEVDAVDNGKESGGGHGALRPGLLRGDRYGCAHACDGRAAGGSGDPGAGSVRREDDPHLALSANTYEEDVRRSLEAGMNAHLAKPIEVAELSAALHKYMQ
jgi:CheY-like chemotaxis protein